MLFGGAKERIRIGRLNSLASACDDSQSEFSQLRDCLVTIRQMDRSAIAKWQETWPSQRSPPEGGWDWPAIHDLSRRKTDEYCVAIWHENTTLCGLFLLIVDGNSIRVKAIEGNPDDNHPLKGFVVAIGIDVAERLADALGRKEIWLVEPADGLIELYVNVMGFELHEVGNGGRVCKRRV
jgi:hypothetical protein